MTELRHDPDHTFWEIVESNDLDSFQLGPLLVDEASKDRDLVTFCELKILQKTSERNEKRASLIEDMVDGVDEEGMAQLLSEIRCRWGLTDAQMTATIRACEQSVRQRQHDELDWLEQ